MSDKMNGIRQSEAEWVGIVKIKPDLHPTETIPSPRIWTIVYGLRMTGPLTIDATLPQ